MHNNGFKIPNLGSNAMLNESTYSSQDRMARIIESMNCRSQINESVAQKVCPACGSVFTFDNDTTDGSEPFCPNCGFQANSEQQFSPYTVDTEATLEESVESDEFTSVLLEYYSLVDEDRLDEAKELLASEGITLVVESVDNTIEILEEKVVSVGPKVVGGKVIKKHKTKLTPKQLKARAKAMKKNAKKMSRAAHKPSAMKKRKKSMKVARKRGLIKESLQESYQIRNDLRDLLESRGIFLEDYKLNRLVRESIISESANSAVNTHDNIVTSIENILNNKGLEVIDELVEEDDGVVVVEVSVRDIDAEIFLGEICDEIAQEVGAEVDCEDPEADDDDSTVVDLVFYIMPIRSAVSESFESRITERSMNESTNLVGDATYQLFESCAGGASNVRCRLDPSFIKEGQVILDADSGVVFEALSESVALDDSYQLTIGVISTVNESFRGLTGAVVEIESDGNYYLLKDRP